MSGNAYACENHAFLRIGAGIQGQWFSPDPGWIGDDELAAAFSVGYRWSNGWDIQLSHNSQWFVGPPFNDDFEDELDSLTIGYEWRWK